MGHQNRDGALAEHVAREAAENCFAPAIVGIGAHDDKPGVFIADRGRQEIFRTLAAR